MERISRLRSFSSFHRRPGHEPPRSITLIVCEGETEQEYFDAARAHYGLSRTEVIIAENTEGSAPISVVECALRKGREAGGYDRIFCVFDRDGHESFARAREKIAALATRKKKPLPISEAVSIPCFELWLLLHFERTDAAFANCATVIRRLREDDKLSQLRKGRCAHRPAAHGAHRYRHRQCRMAGSACRRERMESLYFGAPPYSTLGASSRNEPVAEGSIGRVDPPGRRSGDPRSRDRVSRGNGQALG